MDMQLRERLLDCHKNTVVVLVGLVGVDSTLDANLGGTAVDRVLALLEDLLEAAIIGVDRIVLMPRKSAKRAAHVTDIGEIDVAAHHVADIVTAILAACQIARGDQRMEIHPPNLEQELRIANRQFFAPESAFEQSEYQSAVRAIFDAIDRPYIRRIDAAGSREEVAARIAAAVTERLEVSSSGTRL